MVNEKQKGELLEHFLREDTCKTAIVFTRTKHRARRLAERLDRAGHRAVALPGNMSQPQRDRAMRGFRTGQFSVLVATDIVARGIDVSNVSHVINYDVPTTPEAYTHRIGRTGRAERDGVARTFVTGEDHAWVRATERMIGSAIQRYEVSGFQTDFRVPEAPKVVEASAPRTTYGSRSRRRTRNRRFGSGNRSRSGRPSA